MEVRTFRADSLQEALQQVREALGPEASVLHTRELKKSRFGIFSHRMIEVEASVDVPVVRKFPNAVPQGKTSVQPPEPVSAESHRPSTVIDEQRSAPEGFVAAREASEAATHALPNHAYDSAQDEATSAQAVYAASDDRRFDSGAASFSTSRRDLEGAQSLTPAKFEALSLMIDSGIEPADAKALLSTVCARCTPEQQQDTWLLQGQVSQLISSRMNTSGPLELVNDEQKIVAFVGPTGVGKTTTLAKIAAGFRFDLGCQVGLITLDTFRLGAVDQLLQYAELISAPLEVVSSPDEVTGALQRLRECDLVLLDTAGRAPKDSAQLSQLKDFLDAAEPDSVQLVVSATSSVGHVQETMRQFSSLQPTDLLITKLDEAVGFGQWLNLLDNSELSVSYLTAGQQVPQDISVASPRRLASMLLGQSQHLHTTPGMVGRMEK